MSFKFAVLILLIAFECGCSSHQMVQTHYSLGQQAYIAKDYSAARKHWARAIEQGELYAFNNLGYLLYHGLGGPSDPNGAVKLWRRGAAAGDSEAQWHLGYAHEIGKGAPQSNVEAYAWYRCAIANAEISTSTDAMAAAIAKGARRSLTELLPRLSADQITESEALAEHYIESYVRKPGA
jgi:hypothetical protein